MPESFIHSVPRLFSPIVFIVVMHTQNNESQAASKVLRNELILGKIMIYALRAEEDYDETPDADGNVDHDQYRPCHKWRKFLKLRLVNKRFNSACLAELRFTFRHLAIGEYFPTERIEPDAPENECSINFNGFTLPFAMTAGCLRFLQSAAKVSIQSLTVRDCWKKFENNDKQDLHQILVDILDMKNCNSIIGMEDLCRFGCSWCSKMAQKCRVWGPMQLNALLNVPWKQPVHYERLEVSEFLMSEIADLCSKKNSKEECLAEVKRLITTSISCDYLIITLSAKPYFSDGTFTKSGMFSHNPYAAPPLPLEVLAQILSTWQPKRVKLHFDGSEHDVSESWWSTRKFTNFRLDLPVEKNSWHQLSNIGKMDLVEIDGLTDLYIQKEMGKTTFGDSSASSYENLVANVRKLIPCGALSFSTHWLIALRITGLWANGMLDSILKNNQRNLDVIVEVLSVGFSHPKFIEEREQFGTPDVFGSGARLVSSDTPSQWKLLEVTSTRCEHNNWRDPAELRGQCFKLRNEEANVNVNFEIFVRHKDLKEYFKGVASLEKTGFIRHYWHDWKNNVY